MPRRPKPWRKSDQTNAELPMGQAYCDVSGIIQKVLLKFGTDINRKFWIAYPEHRPDAFVIGEAPLEAIKALDKQLTRYNFNHPMH